jgi:hypothetical protein
VAPRRWPCGRFPSYPGPTGFRTFASRGVFRLSSLWASPA